MPFRRLTASSNSPADFSWAFKSFAIMMVISAMIGAIIGGGSIYLQENIGESQYCKTIGELNGEILNLVNKLNKMNS